jgi:Mg-chelatase subunit ChlD
MLASALSRRDIRVEHTASDVAAWTNGSVIYVSGAAPLKTQLKELCVQSALIAAGSMEREVIKRLARRPELTKRYLAVEGQRALAALEDVCPPLSRSLINHAMAARSHSPTASLNFAMSRENIDDPPYCFGAIRVRELLTAQQDAGGSGSNDRHVPRQQQAKKLTELTKDVNSDDEDIEDFASSPVSGSGGFGQILQKMFQMIRKVKGDGAPGADAATHWSRSGARTKIHALRSSSTAETVDDAFGKGVGILYPEWDIHQRRYKSEWCTVKEIDPPIETHESVVWMAQSDLRKPLARFGMGLDRYHRQAQGDDIDIDAAIEAQLEIMAGTASDGSVYIESKRCRRDLSVLILLDTSGSVSQDGRSGKTVHDQQRSVAAVLTTILHRIGDRVALYAFQSQGRTEVHLIPVKRFNERLDNAVMSRLYSLKPGAYSRLGAAIRHGASVLIERSGTSRRLLVVLSDGLAYDHGYEPKYGAADTRQALGEARRDGVGCLCICIGANTDTDILRRVFGSAAYTVISNNDQLSRVISPLFRSALRSTDVRRMRSIN